MSARTSAAESQRLIAQHKSQRKQRYYKAVLLIFVAVLAGIAIGVSGTVLYFRETFHRVPPQPRAIGASLVEHLNKVVTVTPEENQRIQEIMEAHIKQVEAFRKQSIESYRGMSDEISDVLGSERTQAWNEYKAKAFGKRRGRRHFYRRDKAPDHDAVSH